MMVNVDNEKRRHRQNVVAALSFLLQTTNAAGEFILHALQLGAML